MHASIAAAIRAALDVSSILPMEVRQDAGTLGGPQCKTDFLIDEQASCVAVVYLSQLMLTDESVLLYAVCLRWLRPLVVPRCVFA